MRYWIILALAVLLFSGSATAAFVTTEFTRSPAVSSVTIITGQYQDTCAAFIWRGVTDDTNSDFNTFVVRLSSNKAEFNGDVNTTNSWYTACTIASGEWVKAIIYRVDGNAEGIFLNIEPDANVTVNPGTMAQSGIYLLYNILVAMGGIIALVVLAVVFAFFMKKTGFKLRFN